MSSGSLYKGKGTGPSGDKAVELPVSPLLKYTKASGYRADQGLVDAVNVALRLGQPLLLTGEPGTGKTQLAHSLTWELGFGETLKFETKSTSQSRDLFYIYDALGRFNAAQADGQSANTLDYITFNALGRAILYANEPAAVSHLTANMPAEQVHKEKRRSVVLIDEIDKAPRDFPNDLLNEIEHLYFHIPELNNERVEADHDMRPVLVLTSNSEKNLPEAFLRRCIFYDLPFPEDRLEEILIARLGESIVEDPQTLEKALGLFMELRSEKTGLTKPPSTSELIAWLHDLKKDGSLAQGWGEHMIETSLVILIKTGDDRKKARKVVDEWSQRLTT